MARPIPDHLRSLLHHPIPDEIAQREFPEDAERRRSGLKLFIEKFIRKQPRGTATEAVLLDIMRVEKLAVTTPELVRFLLEDLRSEGRAFLRKGGATWGVEEDPMVEAPSAINLPEILLRVHRRESAVTELAFRHACLLAKQRTPHLQSDQQAILESVGDGRESTDTVLNDKTLHALITQNLFNEARREVRASQARLLGTASFRQIAWEVLVEEVFDAIARSSPGFLRYSGPDIVLDNYCGELRDGKEPSNVVLHGLLIGLETEGFATVLLEKLWEECPGEARLMNLPPPANAASLAESKPLPAHPPHDYSQPKCTVSASATYSAKVPKKLPNLQKYDRQAYQLSLIHGMKQEQIAERLNKEHGTTYDQGQISRMINRAQRHAEASGLSDLIPPRATPAKAIDPTKLELGPRSDPRPPDKRATRDPA